MSTVLKFNAAESVEKLHLLFSVDCSRISTISIGHLHCVVHIFVEIKANCSQSSAVAMVCLSPILNSYFFHKAIKTYHKRSKDIL